jgi:Uma2 family endonuclease
MAIVTTTTVRGNGYPTSDRRPMAETDLHRDLMTDLIHRFQGWFAADPRTYVSGNLLLFYEPGNKRKYIAPDVFVVRGVPAGRRDNYLVWEEGKGPDFVIELTSRTTRKEDTDRKFKLYRDVLQVREYFLFDPRQDYLQPALQGFKLQGNEYGAIAAVDRRLPSEICGLHLERNGQQLELFDPGARQRLTSATLDADPRLVDLERRLRLLERDFHQEKAARLAAEAEILHLRKQLDALRGEPAPPP